VQEDLFEAILGAAAIDSGWDLDRLEIMAQIMLGIDSLGEPEEDYVTLIQDWTAKKGIGTPQYFFREGGMQITLCEGFSGISQAISVMSPEFNRVRFHCCLEISEEVPPFRGFGASKSEARRNVCALAWEYLEKHGLLFSVRDELPEPRREEAVSQLEILARRGYFDLPQYVFDQTYDKNGNPVWHCRCSIPEENAETGARSGSKKDAKKQAAWEMLQRILEKE
jgi:ribonuclease-3